MTSPPDLAAITQAPKALLHDHLDGGMRPATMLELADQVGYEGLPASDVVSLTAWIQAGSHRGSLLRYLAPLHHAVGVMQSTSSLYRVARECVEDLAADNVVYAEVRFAPELHTAGGLTLDDVVDAVLAGFADGQRAVRGDGRFVAVRCLVTAMRDATRSLEIAELAIRFRDRGVVGFDLAGAEAGFPPAGHLDAFDHLRRHDGRVTVHAGEAFGLPSIRQAVDTCGAERIGHGVRIVDDIDQVDGGAVTAVLGDLAEALRRRRMPLELCPSSNVQTGVVASIAEHPVDMLARLGFRVTINTDNRMLSGTTMSEELLRLVEAFGYGWADLEQFTVNAMESAFIPPDERRDIIDGVIKPGFAALTD